MSSLVDDAVSGLRTAASSRVSTSRIVTIIALSLIALQLAFRAWAVYRGWFVADDYVFLSDVASGNADLEWFFHRHNVHFMPVGFLLAFLVGSAGTFNWPAAATELIVLQALANLACWWMLRTLFGNRARILVPLTFFLFAAFSMPALMWWASGINLLPVQIAIFGAVTTNVLYLRTGKKRYAVLAALSLGFGLLSYVKAILIPMVLGIMALLYFAKGPLPRRLITVVRAYWFGWVLYAAVAGTYLVLYVLHGDEAAAPTGSADYPTVGYEMVVSSLGTGLLGGPWRWVMLGEAMRPRLLADPAPIVVTASVLILVILLTLVASRWRGALKPLYFLVPLVIASFMAIATGRAATFGAGASLDIRYWTDFLPYAALGIGLMVMPLLGATDPLVARGKPWITFTPPRWTLGAFGILFIAGSLFSSVTYVTPWHENFAGRSYVETAEAQLKGRPVPAVLANQNVPETVLPSLLLPYNQMTLLLAPLSSNFRTPDVATDLSVLDQQGLIQPGTVEGGMIVGAEAIPPCLKHRADGRSTTLELGAKTFDYPFWLAITYYSPDDGAVTVRAGETWRRGPVKKGSHTLFVKTEGAYDRLSLAPSEGTEICISAIQIGPIVVPR